MGSTDPSTSAADAMADGPAFDEATATVATLVERDRIDPLIAPAALPRFYGHGQRVRDAVVLFHGFTNCPQQFDELARRLHARGANVYVPRLPLHGLRDRLTRALGQLSNAQVAGAATQAYELARGLGVRVTALGLSLGGSMALYLAQTQTIDRAIAIAPFLIPIGFPQPLGLAAMKLARRFPDRYLWWDPRVKERCLPPYAYPGYPLHGLAECVLFGDSIVRAARSRRAPLGRRCTLVLNATEAAVNNAVAERLIDDWNAAGARYDRMVVAGLGRVHDIIDPTTYAKAETLVYPKLETLVFDDAG